MSALTPEDTELELELPAAPSSVGIARKATTELAHRVGADADNVELAVSEAMANSVMHAFRGREPGTVVLHAALERRYLRISITDDGMGMTPNVDSEGLGLGISLITKLADRVRFDSSDHGTTVEMQFKAEGGIAS